MDYKKNGILYLYIISSVLFCTSTLTMEIEEGEQGGHDMQRQAHMLNVFDMLTPEQRAALQAAQDMIPPERVDLILDLIQQRRAVQIRQKRSEETQEQWKNPQHAQEQQEYPHARQK